MRKIFLIILIALLGIPSYVSAARDGNGNHLRIHNWSSDSAAGIKIDSGRMDAEFNDMANSLTQSISKDGQTTITGNIPFSTNKITGLGSGTARTDALNVGDLQDGGFLWGGTATGTDTIVVNLSPAVTTLSAGMKVRFLAAGANAGTTVTINLNATGAITFRKEGGTALAIGDIKAAGQVVEAIYDGTEWEYSNFDSTTDLASPGAIGGTTPGAATFTTITGNTSLALSTGATITGIADEDTMSSNSATLAATQQSIKAYADTKSGTLDRDLSTVTVANTTTETSIYSFTVSANQLSTNKLIKANIAGTFLQNSGGTRTVTIRLKYGATTIASDVVTVVEVNPASGFIINAFLAGDDSANAQKGWFHFQAFDDSQTVEHNPAMVVYGTGAEDSTGALTFDVTIQHNFASANLSLIKEAAFASLE